jgi:surface antigen
MNNGINTLIVASRFAIAASIVYFAYQLAQVNGNVTVAMALADQISQQIEPALIEVKEIREEIAEVRKLVPPMLAQLKSIDKQIDPILKRVDKTVAVVDKTQRQIPLIIDTADNAIAVLNQTREEVVPLVPPLLDEIRLTRETIDPTLDRFDDLVEVAYDKAIQAIGAADQAGQKASEGAVKGFFTGLIKLPFDLVGTLASPIIENLDRDVVKQLSEKDIELMAEAGDRSYKSDKVDKEHRWENPDSGNSGSITILRKYQLKGAECVEGRSRISNKRKQIMDEVNNYCQDEEGKWGLAADIEN